MAVIIHSLSPPLPFVPLWSILTAARLRHPAATPTLRWDVLSPWEQNPVPLPWPAIPCLALTLLCSVFHASHSALATQDIQVTSHLRDYTCCLVAWNFLPRSSPACLPHFLPVCAETSLQWGWGSLGRAAPLYFSSECLSLVDMFVFTAVLPRLELCMANGECSTNIYRAGKRMKEQVERAERLQHEELG